MASFADLVARADRASFAVLGGETVMYASEGVAPVPVTGMFDAQYVLAQGDAHAGVEATGPAVFFRRSDLPLDPEDDDPTLTIDGVDYRVIERKEAGLGGIVLVLRRLT